MIRSASVGRWLVRAVVAGALLFANTETARAQFLATGSIQGVVQDEAGVPIFDVIVTLDPRGGGLERSDTTNRDGRFSISFLPPGVYDVIAERLGFRPQRMQGVEVLPGRLVSLTMEIVLAQNTPQTVDIVPWDGGMAAALTAGLSASMLREQFEVLPWASRDLIDASRITGFLGPNFESRGMPGAQTGVFLDGIPVRGALHPLLGSGSTRTAVLPLAALDRAEVLLDVADVEFSGFLGGMIGAHGRAGSNATGVDVWIDGTAGALQSSSNYDVGDAVGASVRGGAVLQGPILRDTAQYLIGVEYERSDRPRGPLLDPDDAGSAAILERLGPTYAGLGEAFGALEQSVTAFGSLDWQVTGQHRVFVRGNVGLISEAQAGLPGGGLDAGSSGTDIVFAAGVASRINPMTGLEFKFGIDRTDRDYETLDDPLATPYTAVASGGSPFGLAPTLNGSFKSTLLSISETLYAHSPSHQFKLGGGVWLMTDARTVMPSAPSFYYSDPGALSAGRGLFSGPTGVGEARSFNRQQYWGFIQDRWLLTPEIELVYGFRGEMERIPLDDIPADPEWDALAGVDNERVPDQPDFKASPRVGFTWNVGGVGRYYVRGIGGVYYGLLDADMLAEALTAGTRGTRLTVGPLGSWPTAPARADATTRSLSILAHDFRAPRSERGSLGLGVALGGGVAFDVSGTYARATGLPRRTDLNRLPGVVETDMDGRPIYGVLVKDGSLLYADPGSNRRFEAYDNVYTLNSDGTNETVSISGGLERRSADGPSFFARYTFTRSTDDWLNAGLAPFGQTLSPFDFDDEWNNGTADAEVPHRLVAGLNLTVPGVPVRAGAFYSFSSGRPFTPGFPPGVDMNGDGVFGNDPAFLGAGFPSGDVTCDGGSGFAERNSCRDPAVHRLDLRASFDLPVGETGHLAIFVDALNLLDSELAIRDHAAYRLDPSGPITRSNGTITVPLVSNTNFGNPLVQLSSGRTLRLGLQVRY